MKTNYIMATRYFQHLNPRDKSFQKVTTLEFVDNADPTFVMYYFADGSKCNAEFIGALNEKDVFGKKEFAEVSSPSNKWVFSMKPDKPEEPAQKIRTANGEWVEVPNENQWFGGDEAHFGSSAKKTSEADRYSVKTAPKYVEPVAEDDSFNFNEPVEVPVEKIETKAEKTPAKAAPITVNPVSISNEFKLDDIADSSVLDFTLNGKKYSMTKLDLLTNAIKTPEERVVIKEVKKEVAEDHIEIGLDATQKGLIDNMIDMSNKEHCDIDMSLTLNLPPMSVYKLIKSVYPKGMAEGFVNIIADRMQTVQLKKAVALGLLAYYDEDSSIEVEETTIKKEEPTDVSVEEAPKKRAKKTAK